MKSSTLTWIIIVIIIVLGAWYILSGHHAVAPTTAPEGNSVSDTTSANQTNPENNSATTPSVNLGLNGSVNQTNTGKANVPAVVKVANDSTLGAHLVATNDMTLYMYTKDTANVSNCDDGCASNWPPYAPVPNEPLVPGDGVKGKLSVITRTDGTTQLTYNGKPLYFWANDIKPGDVTGQNVGGVWFVVKP